MKTRSFFGRTYNNLGSISECKSGGICVIDKKNRTSCKACRLRKCLMVGMSKSGSRYGRRSNWFKIHCLLQEQAAAAGNGPPVSPGTGLVGGVDPVTGQQQSAAFAAALQGLYGGQRGVPRPGSFPFPPGAINFPSGWKKEQEELDEKKNHITANNNNTNGVLDEEERVALLRAAMQGGVLKSGSRSPESEKSKGTTGGEEDEEDEKDGDGSEDGKEGGGSRAASIGGQSRPSEVSSPSDTNPSPFSERDFHHHYQQAYQQYQRAGAMMRSSSCPVPSLSPAVAPTPFSPVFAIHPRLLYPVVAPHLPPPPPPLPPPPTQHHSPSPIAPSRSPTGDAVRPGGLPGVGSASSPLHKLGTTAFTHRAPGEGGVPPGGAMGGFPSADLLLYANPPLAGVAVEQVEPIDLSIRSSSINGETGSRKRKRRRTGRIWGHEGVKDGGMRDSDEGSEDEYEEDVDEGEEEEEEEEGTSSKKHLLSMPMDLTRRPTEIPQSG
ncbi:hypothetical protein J437_LFUL004234 [Ladona fulva]|uniref:Nuclear receptor domain-containing protein n=1 Tax=Ladona fulva TaxID=123851 RepID=A0A8K0K4N6_LADFU|nr:hypothetical protein J437_LFUL004234 [Ladona fulva]